MSSRSKLKLRRKREFMKSLKSWECWLPLFKALKHCLIFFHLLNQQYLYLITRILLLNGKLMRSWPEQPVLLETRMSWSQWLQILGKVNLKTKINITPTLYQNFFSLPDNGLFVSNLQVRSVVFRRPHFHSAIRIQKK